MLEIQSAEDPEPSGFDPIPSISQNENYHPYLYQVPALDPAKEIIEAVRELTPEPRDGDKLAFRRERKIGNTVLVQRKVLVRLKEEDEIKLQEEINSIGIVTVDIPSDDNRQDGTLKLPAGLYSVRRSNEDKYSIVRGTYDEETDCEHEHAVDEETALTLLALLRRLGDK